MNLHTVIQIDEYFVVHVCIHLCTIWFILQNLNVSLSCKTSNNIQFHVSILHHCNIFIDVNSASPNFQAKTPSFRTLSIPLYKFSLPCYYYVFQGIHIRLLQVWDIQYVPRILIAIWDLLWISRNYIIIIECISNMFLFLVDKCLQTFSGTIWLRKSWFK